MEEIVRYLGIDTRTQLLAERLWHLLEEPSDEIIDSFYREIQQSAAGLLVDESTIERLKIKQKEHWRALLNGEFDEQYQRSVTMIGIKHHEIGLDPKWYVAGYALMKVRFVKKLLEAPIPLHMKSALIETLEKYAAVDMAMALSTYSAWLIE